MQITMMNWADYVIIGIIALSALISLIRGFVREALSLVTWVVALWVAFTFHGILANLLVSHIHSDMVRTAVAFGSLFLASLILGGLINYLIGQLVDKTGLSGTDRVLGVAFGFARGVLLVSILLMLVKLTPMPNEAWWKSSLLTPQFSPVEGWLSGYLPQSFSEHVDVSY